MCTAYMLMIKRSSESGSDSSVGRRIGSDAVGLGFESQTGRVRGKSIISLPRDKHPAIKGLRPPEHHAGQFQPDQKDSSESEMNALWFSPMARALKWRRRLFKRNAETGGITLKAGKMVRVCMSSLNCFRAYKQENGQENKRACRILWIVISILKFKIK